MRIKQRGQYEMLLRVRDFITAHQHLLAQSPTAQKLFASVNTAINDLTAADLVKMSASLSARADRKRKALTSLLDLLAKVSQLTRLLRAGGLNVPAFQVPRSRSAQTLLTAARKFAQDAAPFDAELAGHRLGSAVINETVAELEAAVSDRGMQRSDHIQARGRIRERLASALVDVRRLDLIIDRELAGNEPVRESWNQLRHVLGTRAAGSTATVAEPAQPSA
jgi:hypothetical protein